MPLARPASAVVFDMDGVLCESETISRLAAAGQASAKRMIARPASRPLVMSSIAALISSRA